MYNITSKILLIISVIIATSNINAEQLAMGAWRTHIAYNNTNQITQSKNKVYAISSGALYSISKDDYSNETYSKLFGLSDNNIKYINYSQENNLLFIAYNNSNIDLIDEFNNIYNITDIYRKSINGDKTINDACFYGDYAYLACGFGLIKLDMKKREISDTYLIGDLGKPMKFTDIAINDNKIYALSENSLLYANMSGSNLLNYQNWNKFPDPDNTSKNLAMAIINNKIFLVKSNNILYEYSNNSWQQNSTNVKDIYVDNNLLFIQNTSNHISALGNITLLNILNSQISDALYDINNNMIWVTTGKDITSLNITTNETRSSKPTGPAENTVWRIEYSNNRMYVVHGGRFAVNYFNPGHISIFEDNQWQNIYSYELTQYSPTNRCYDFVDILPDPNDKKHFWVASYGLGLYEFQNDKFYQLHTVDNSNIESAVQSNPYNYMRIDGLIYDTNGNLWFTNTGGARIKYRDTNGGWHALNYNELAGLGTVQDILISKTHPNVKFVFCPRYIETGESYLFVFDDKGTLNNTKDDTTKGYTSIKDQDNKTIQFNLTLLKCIAQDNNGVIWLGTTNGPLLITDINKIFNSDFQCHKIKVPREDGSGLADYLLLSEQINDIKIDGANRKWIATENNGAYLLSEDGLTTIHHFTSENSPLLSNTVQKIGINDQTGEVFFGTGNGLISFQSDAIAGGDKFNNVHAFPNPVRPEFNGLITITGLIADTNVKITDVNGNLIFETISNGGVATWNGCRASGERVATGVYFAHCVSSDKKNKTIAKILIIN